MRVVKLIFPSVFGIIVSGRMRRMVKALVLKTSGLFALAGSSPAPSALQRARLDKL